MYDLVRFAQKIGRIVSFRRLGVKHYKVVESDTIQERVFFELTCLHGSGLIDSTLGTRFNSSKSILVPFSRFMVYTWMPWISKSDLKIVRHISATSLTPSFLTSSSLFLTGSRTSRKCCGMTVFAILVAF